MGGKDGSPPSGGGPTVIELLSFWVAAFVPLMLAIRFLGRHMHLWAVPVALFIWLGGGCAIAVCIGAIRDGLQQQ